MALGRTLEQPVARTPYDCLLYVSICYILIRLRAVASVEPFDIFERTPFFSSPK